MPEHLTKFGPRDIAVAVMMNLLWGFNIIAAKLALNATGPFTAALLRQVIVFLVCAAWLRIVPGKMRSILLLGLLSGGLFFATVNLSIEVATNVSALAIAGQLGVPFALILGVVVLKEKIHAYRIVGVLLSLAGVAILVFDPRAADELPGIALTALGSLFYAFGSLIQRGLQGVPIATIYAWIGLIGALFLGPLALAIEPEAMAAIPELHWSSLGWLAFSAIGSTLLGHGSMAWLLQRHPISQVMPLTLAAPVIAVVAASLFFQTPLTGLMILGGLVTLTGVAIVTVRSAMLDKKQLAPQLGS